MKYIAAVWMITWFVILFRSTVLSVNRGIEPFAAIMALGTVWVLIGLVPVLIVKLAVALCA